MTQLRGALIGQHISRSRLRTALQIMCDAAGWSLDFKLIDTAKRSGFDFAETIRRAQADGLSGVTVTHPFKRHARAFAGASMVAEVAHLGAANTLVFAPQLVGHNTDYTGFQSVLDDADLGALGDCLVMGAGGVAEALVPALAQRKASHAVIYVSDTDKDRAANLASGVEGAEACPIEDLALRAREADGLVNATPLGMVEYPGSAFEGDWIERQRWVFDAVYTPTNTMFLGQAREVGLKCLTGFDLFRAMAMRSFQAYTGVVPDAAELRHALDQLRPD